MTSSRSRQFFLFGVIVLLLAWLGWREWYYSAWMDDDAFISFRYARNVVLGRGLVFNVGEHVEGYTNFLWTIILAGLNRLGMDIPRAAQILGAACSIFTVLLLAGPGSGVFPESTGTYRRWNGFVGAVLLCILEPWAVWAVGGLENTFGAFLVTAAFLTYFDALGKNPASLVLPGLLSALAALTNPSFAIFGMVLVVHAAMSRLDRISRLVAFVGPIVLVGTPYLCWKQAYYGHLLPNTFRAKVGLQPAVLLRGVQYYFEAAAGLPIPIIAVAVAPFVLRRLRITDSRPWLLFWASAAYLFYGLCIGGDAFPAFRLLIVALPLQLLLVQYLTGLIPAGRVNRFVVPLVLVLGVFSGGYFSPRVRELDKAIEMDFLGLFKAAGMKLRAVFPPDALFASSGAGVIPYYCDFRLIDTLGLIDEHIAGRVVENFGEGVAGHEKGDGRYVFERKPDVIMFGSGSISGFKPCFPGDYELVAVPGFHERYQQVVPIVRFHPHGGSIEVFCEMPLYVKRGVRVNLVAGERRSD